MGVTLSIVARGPIAQQKICGQYIISYLQQHLQPLHFDRIIIINGPEELQSMSIESPVTSSAFVEEIKQSSDSHTFLIVPANFLHINLQLIENLLELVKDAPLALLTFVHHSPQYHKVEITDEQAFIQPLSYDEDEAVRHSGIMAINTTYLEKDHDLHSIAAKHLMMHDDDYRLLHDGHDLAAVTAEMQGQLRAKHLERGVIFIDPSTVYLSFDTKVEPGTIIYPHVFIGPGVEIAAEATILSFSHIAGTKIGPQVQIGPFANIRGNTTIQANSQIGNFVEIKNSKIDQGVKIKHLSYIGDAEVGSNTNIGAGVITCNYDGQYKHRTVIEKNCFIGANSSLIAPLYIAERVIVGAGSTITKDVEKNSLALARAQQVIKKK